MFSAEHVATTNVQINIASFTPIKGHVKVATDQELENMELPFQALA